jgi:hypothetical protein
MTSKSPLGSGHVCMTLTGDDLQKHSAQASSIKDAAAKVAALPKAQATPPVKSNSQAPPAARPPK